MFRHDFSHKKCFAGRLFHIIFLMILLLPIIGCSQKKSTTPGQEEFEQYYSFQIYQNEPFMNMLHQVRSDIMSSVGVKAEFRIINDPEPNASMALVNKKDPYLFITTGLIKILGNSKDEYAFVMAHECAHLARQHIKKNRSKEKGLNKVGGALITATEIVGMAFGLPLALFSSMAVDSGTAMASLSYSRDQEQEADRLALDYMHSAGYDINGAIEFMEKIMSATDSPSLPLLSTHPTYEDRFAYLDALVKEKRAALARKDLLNK